MKRNQLTQSTESADDQSHQVVSSLSRRSLLKKAASAGIVSLSGVVAATGEARAYTWPTYSQGAQGPDIHTIQGLLAEFHHYIEYYDGIYGPATEGAVIDFQREQNLTVDGIVGPYTWDALATIVLSRGDGMSSSRQGVSVAQLQLVEVYGYNIAVDGRFGPGTETAVRSFQDSRNLTVDGIIGPNTWRALVSTG